MTTQSTATPIQRRYARRSVRIIANIRFRAHYMSLRTVFLAIVLGASSQVDILAQDRSFSYEDSNLTKARAEVLIAFARESFWGKVKSPADGRLFEPKDEAERLSGPIPERDALYLSQAAVLAGLARSCGMDANPYLLNILRPVGNSYGDIKQIVFASLLFGIVARDVEDRRRAIAQCSDEYRKSLSQTIAFVMERNLTPGSRPTPKDGATQTER